MTIDYRPRGVCSNRMVVDVENGVIRSLQVQGGCNGNLQGISRLVAEKCDFSCRLPQRGRVESLNVAQATTVLCYEWLRRVECGGEADA